MAETAKPQENYILDALPEAERERLYSHLKLVPLPLGKVLYESGDTLRLIAGSLRESPGDIRAPFDLGVEPLQGIGNGMQLSKRKVTACSRFRRIHSG